MAVLSITPLISADTGDTLARAVAAIERVAALPGYQAQALGHATAIAQHAWGPSGVFMGYDFHLGAEGPRLIEINTNAGGGMLNAALARERGTQRLQFGAFGCADQVAALHQTGRGFFIAQVARKVVEHRPRALGQFHVFDHRIVGAQDAGRLGAGARADLAAVQHEHAARTQAGQVVSDRSTDHTGTDHDGVVGLHGKSGLSGLEGWADVAMERTVGACRRHPIK